jgi:hypothetical protein
MTVTWAAQELERIDAAGELLIAVRACRRHPAKLAADLGRARRWAGVRADLVPA